MECPFITPVKVIESNGSIVDAKNEMVLKVLYSNKNFNLQVKQLHYTAKAINNHKKLVEALRENYEYTKYAGANKKVNTDEYMEEFFNMGLSAQQAAKQALKEAETE